MEGGLTSYYGHHCRSLANSTETSTKHQDVEIMQTFLVKQNLSPYTEGHAVRR